MVVLMGTLGLTSCAASAAGGSASPSPTSSSSAAVIGTDSSAGAGMGSVAAPLVCDAVDLKPGATVSGTDLAACVVAYSTAAGSGHEVFTASDGTSGEVDFEFGDAPAMSGSVTASDGTTSFVLTPSESWVTIDGAWVRGVSGSSDPHELLADTVGQAYRAMADPSVAAGFLSASASWTVQEDQDVITLPGGEEVLSWRVQSDAPFPAFGGEVQEMIVWLTSGHVPVGNQATVSVGGVQTTTSQQYSSWGMPVSIVPPTQ